MSKGQAWFRKLQSMWNYNVKIILTLSFISVCLTACLSQAAMTAPVMNTITPVPSSTEPHNIQPTPTKTGSPTPNPSPTLPAPTTTYAPSPIPSPLPSSTPVSSPTPVILRGAVIPEKVSCRYGPGAMYLYLYGLIAGANQDIIGRTDSGSWLLTRARGSDTVCWIKAEFLQIQGDVMQLEQVYPDKFTLIQSNQGYRSPWDVVAIRKGNEVVLSWKSEDLRPGDEESANSVLYVVETWLCQNGQLRFTPLGAYVPQVTVTDEPGCAQPSHGRVYFSEKHGYAGPTDIIWPPAP